jgi:protein SCO1/2
LGDYFRDGKPVIMVLSYYQCPMLCGLVLQGMVSSFKQIPWQVGDQYRVLTVSIDPRDGPVQAEKKQHTALLSIGRSDHPEAWPFLVGEAKESAALADALGFRYEYDPQVEQYAHPAAIYVLTPDGRISRYLYGVTYGVLDLRLALIEAGSGKVGNIVDRVILTCYQYDPASRRYGPTILGFFRVGAALILLSVGTLLALLALRERQRTRRTQGRLGKP